MTLVLPARPSSWVHRVAFSIFEGAKAHARIRIRSRQLRAVRVQPTLSTAGLVLVLVVRDEVDRIPFFLQYYRGLQVEHFIVIDNESMDGLQDLLHDEADVSVFRAVGSYRAARYGNDWVNGLLARYCVGKWVLYVDVDEFLVFDDSERRTIVDLVARLGLSRRRAFAARMLDMYSDKAVVENRYRRGANPVEVCDLFDSEGYESQYESMSLTTWVKGGPRGRTFFPDPQLGPALNKIPLVLWARGYAYLKSSHQLWPLRLNRDSTDSSFSGVLLHQKFLASFVSKVKDPDHRGEHTEEYVAYDGAALGRTFRNSSTARFSSSADLVSKGMMRALRW